MSNESKTTDQYGTSVLLANGIKEALETINRNTRECLFSDPRPAYVPSLGEKVISFFKEAKNRVSNACDCLVKGVDPYDY